MTRPANMAQPRREVRTVHGGTPSRPESYVIENIEMAEKAADAFIPIWEECLAFFDNDQWVERSAVSGQLVTLETREGSLNAKPRWRSRLTRNRYTPGIERARSRFASRIPPPRCSAPSHNAEARSAASLAEKALLSAHRKLKIKKLVLSTMVYTFNCGGGYVWPYWNPDVGPFIRDTRPEELLPAAAAPELGPSPLVAMGDPPPALLEESGGLPSGPGGGGLVSGLPSSQSLPAAGASDPAATMQPGKGLVPGSSLGPPGYGEPGPPVSEPPPKWLREGEVDFWILHPRDVGWHPGVALRDSRYFYVRRALPAKQVIGSTGYTGPAELSADAVATTNRDARNHVPDANLTYVYHYLERPSKQHRKGRWLEISNGCVIKKEKPYPCDHDIPVIHELADIERPHRDRPMGRGELALDVQRTYHRTINQIVHWKNLVLNPQMLAPKGSIRTPRTGEPGAVIEYRAIGGQIPQWQPVLEIPASLFRTLDQCLSDFQEIFGDADLDLAGMESGTQVAQVRAERDESRRAAFASNLADFYQDIYGHILYLIQRHYTEPRLLEVKTRFGIESIPEFLGATLMPGITVHVDPSDVMPRTREAQEAKLIAFAERGWIPAHQIVALVRGGDADAMIDEFELDIARAHREIQQLIAMGRGEGLGAVFAAPMDNHQVHNWVLGNWMKTEDFERQPDIVHQATMAHFQQHEAEIAFQAMEQMQQQLNAAQARGMSGAAGGKPSDGGGASPSPGQGSNGNGPVVSQPSMESNVRALQGAPSATH